jgi:hypothetical protein
MSAAEVNIEALMEVYTNVSFGCFIRKPVTIAGRTRLISNYLIQF